jgi:hypothetical protein
MMPDLLVVLGNVQISLKVRKYIIKISLLVRLKCKKNQFGLKRETERINGLCKFVVLIRTVNY